MPNYVRGRLMVNVLADEATRRPSCVRQSCDVNIQQARRQTRSALGTRLQDCWARRVSVSVHDYSLIDGYMMRKNFATPYIKNFFGGLALSMPRRVGIANEFSDLLTTKSLQCHGRQGRDACVVLAFNVWYPKVVLTTGAICYVRASIAEILYHGHEVFEAFDCSTIVRHVSHPSRHVTKNNSGHLCPTNAYRLLRR